jgi:hypothetical protein
LRFFLSFVLSPFVFFCLEPAVPFNADLPSLLSIPFSPIREYRGSPWYLCDQRDYQSWSVGLCPFFFFSLFSFPQGDCFSFVCLFVCDCIIVLYLVSLDGGNLLIQSNKVADLYWFKKVFRNKAPQISVSVVFSSFLLHSIPAKVHVFP